MKFSAFSKLNLLLFLSTVMFLTAALVTAYIYVQYSHEQSLSSINLDQLGLIADLNKAPDAAVKEVISGKTLAIKPTGNIDFKEDGHNPDLKKVYKSGVELSLDKNGTKFVYAIDFPAGVVPSAILRTCKTGTACPGFADFNSNSGADKFGTNFQIRSLNDLAVSDQLIIINTYALKQDKTIGLVSRQIYVTHYE